MRHTFSLFQTPLDKAHAYWKECVRPGDIVVDATCGNGHDTLFLAELALAPGKGCLHVFDIQQSALDETKKRLETSFTKETLRSISFHKECHSKIASFIDLQSVQLIVYNLGYLPGGNKEVTTTVSSTLHSIKESLNLLLPGGVLSITAYPGHPEGFAEEKALIECIGSLNPKEWSICHHTWLNRKKSPSLFIAQKSF